MEDGLLPVLLLVLTLGCVASETSTTTGNLGSPETIATRNLESPERTTGNTESPETLTGNLESPETNISNRRPPNSAQLPSWIKCMQRPKSLNRSEITNVGLDALYWCRNEDIMIPCLERQVPGTSDSNPIDFITSLSLTGQNLQKTTRQLCSSLPEVEEELECVKNASRVAMSGCSAIFKQWVDYIFYIRDKPDITMVTLTNVSCEATMETTRCMDAALSTCSLTTKSFLLGYYGIFSSASCVANATLPQPIERTSEPSEQTILLKCGMEASSKMNASQPVVMTTVQSVIVHVLLQDCGLYRQRLLCYGREFPAATTFLDLWQKQVFDLDRALTAYQQFCSKADEFVKELSTECAPSLDRALQICEGNYGATLRTTENDFINGETSLAELQPLACNASLDRVECLREAFKICSDSAAQLYASSQAAMLPLSCFNDDSLSDSDLLITSTSTSTTTVTLIDVEENPRLPEPTTRLVSLPDQLQPNIETTLSEEASNPPVLDPPTRNGNSNGGFVRNDNSYNEQLKTDSSFVRNDKTNNEPLRADNSFNEENVRNENSNHQAIKIDNSNERTIPVARGSRPSSKNPSQAAITTTRGDNHNTSAIPTFSYLLVFLFLVPFI